MSNQIQFFTEHVKYIVRERKKLRSWLEMAIKDEGKLAGNINFIITSDEALQEINFKYLQSENLTDTVSFNLSDEDSVISGDVYLSIERIIENARKYKVDEETEFKRILIHGLLHLMDYDDTTKTQKETMTKKENLYLQKFIV